MEHKTGLGNLPVEIIELILHHIPDQSLDAHLAQLQHLNKNWSQSTQAKLYTFIDLTRQNFGVRYGKRRNVELFFKTIKDPPSTPGKHVKYLKMDDDVLEYINLQADTSTVVDNLSTLFPNLEYLIKD